MISCEETLEQGPTFQLGLKPDVDDRADTYTVEVNPKQEGKDPKDRLELCVCLFCSFTQ
jgi:hypothetical protein